MMIEEKNQNIFKEQSAPYEVVDQGLLPVNVVQDLNDPLTWK